MTIESALLLKLNTCAFCPNICRPSYPAQAAVQIESQTPSALCLLAIAVVEGRIAFDAEAALTLHRSDAAMASRGHCIYKFDIPELLAQALPQAEA